jgi:hypothetical protein
VVFDNHAVNHYLYKSLPYDPLKAFEPVSLIVQSPLLPRTLRPPTSGSSSTTARRIAGS